MVAVLERQAPVYRVLGLFPALSADAGGVQRSGLTAWRVVRSRFGDGPGGVALFQYGPSNGPVRDEGLVVRTSSKPAAVLAALRRRWRASIVLVWHLSLLRLVPFLRAPTAKVILVLHGIEAWRRLDWLNRVLLRRVHLFLPNSDHTWMRFLSANPQFRNAPRRTVHLGLGSPLASTPPDPTDPSAVLMVSRLSRAEDYKGHREMIAAWPRVLQRRPETELWIAGEGELRPQLEQLARERGLQGRVRFWGRVSEEQKEDLLARCRCLAMPSRAEGFGLVYLEAMRLGRPCLVSTLDAGREVVNPPEAGLAVDPERLEEVAEAVCCLTARGPEWEQRAAQARRRYEHHFTAAQYEARLVAVLDAGARENEPRD